MDRVLNLVVKGQTLALNAGAYQVLEWLPGSPERTVIDVDAPELFDGGQRVAETMRNVTESALILCQGAGAEEAMAAARAIEAALSVENTLHGRVMVQTRWGAGALYEARVLGGRLSYERDTYALLHDGLCRVRVTWTREYAWQAVDEVEVALENSSGSGVGGRSVSGGTDGSHENWVQVTGADVGGTLPARIRLELTNTYNSATRLYTVRIGHNARSNPAGFGHILEGENGGADSVIAHASCSGGAYGRGNLDTDAERVLFEWALPTALLNAAGGRLFRVIGRFIQTQHVLRTRFRLRIAYSVSTLWEGDWLSPDPASGDLTRELATLRLPPWLMEAGSSVPLTLYLIGKRVDATVTAVDLDFIQLTPMDHYRVLTPRGYGLPYGARLVDDGLIEQVYSVSGGLRAGYYIPTGRPIELVPGVDQRLYFLMSPQIVTVGDIQRTLSVRIWYRPRRLTL